MRQRADPSKYGNLRVHALQTRVGHCLKDVSPAPNKEPLVTEYSQLWYQCVHLLGFRMHIGVLRLLGLQRAQSGWE